jgi:probable rRNA maturation factor
MKAKTAPQLALEIQFATAAMAEKWQDVITKRKVGNWIKKALQENATITVRFVGLAESKKLNSNYRNKDYATNILTFPYELQNGIDNLSADLIICLPVLEKEAKQQHKTLEQHLIHLIVHGTLHAQGFDHEDDVEAEAMEQLEISILKKLKQANPYI